MEECGIGRNSEMSILCMDQSSKFLHPIKNKKKKVIEDGLFDFKHVRH